MLKTLKKIRKFALENLGRNRPKEPIFIRFSKYSRWGPEQAQNGMSVDRPVDQPTIRFLTVGDVRQPFGRPP